MHYLEISYLFVLLEKDRSFKIKGQLDLETVCMINIIGRIFQATYKKGTSVEMISRILVFMLQ